MRLGICMFTKSSIAHCTTSKVGLWYPSIEKCVLKYLTAFEHATQNMTEENWFLGFCKTITIIDAYIATYLDSLLQLRAICDFRRKASVIDSWRAERYWSLVAVRPFQFLDFSSIFSWLWPSKLNVTVFCEIGKSKRKDLRFPMIIFWTQIDVIIRNTEDQTLVIVSRARSKINKICAGGDRK